MKLNLACDIFVLPGADVWKLAGIWLNVDRTLH